MEVRALPDRTYKYRITQNEGLDYIIGFIIWPFGITIEAFRNWNKPWSKNIFWLFCIFFGFTFIIAEEGGADSDRYARLFLQYANSDFNLKELANSFYTASDNNYVDIASPLITYIVSRISSNPSLLFAVFGLVFGYFYSRNIWYLLEKINGKITGIVLVYLLTFALLIPIWYINGFRMWTAAQIFLFGALPYLLDGNTKRLFWAGFSILFHFSFMFTFGVLLLYILFRNRVNIYLVFFIATAFIKEIDLLEVRSILFFLPDMFHRKIISYTNPQYAEIISLAQMRLNWYITLSENAVKWVVYALVISIYTFGRRMLKERKGLTSLFCYSILLYGFANLFSLIPGGGRFITVSSVFIFSFLVLFFTYYSKIKGLSLVSILSLPFLLLNCIVSFREGMDYFGFITILSNPIIAAFNIQQSPLIVGLKKLLL